MWFVSSGMFGNDAEVIYSILYILALYGTSPLVYQSQETHVYVYVYSAATSFGPKLGPSSNRNNTRKLKITKQESWICAHPAFCRYLQRVTPEHSPKKWNGGLLGAKWQAFSPHRVSILFPHRLRCYSIALAPLGGLNKGATSIIWHDRCMWKMIGLEFLSTIFRVLVGNEEFADLALRGNLPAVSTYTKNATD